LKDFKDNLEILANTVMGHRCRVTGRLVFWDGMDVLRCGNHSIKFMVQWNSMVPIWVEAWVLKVPSPSFPPGFLYQGEGDKFLLTDFGIANVVDSSKTMYGWYTVVRGP
jgi:hypothetical protein